jgi:hypothetical protein
MAEHTPGPWVFEQPEPPSGPSDIYATRDSRRIWLGQVNGPADARLIAAAPELLEACAAMLSTGWSDDEDAIIAARNAGRVAIAKATGIPERTPMPRP